ncbi:MAG: hypothetical protein EBS84_15545 [Proteobacteria bacterium]|nr:hypothetical protein [Verrucomicrobiota bacterium]NBU10405.1 hypothetical protein [Pseudomonadota bacterium]NDE33698.1 hypothetical protein [Gammaproteobacteria bacterium]NDG86865.1 hypothetical protein [Gammaproteobacteria bacterium]
MSQTDLRALGERYFHAFVLGFALIILFSGAVKFYTLFQGSALLTKEDLLLGVRNDIVLFTAGTIELVCGSCLFLPKFSPNGKIMLVTWLSAHFLAYHIALWYAGNPQHCPCLGTLIDYSPWLRQNGSAFLFAMSLFCFTNGLFMLVFRRKQQEPDMAH